MTPPAQAGYTDSFRRYVVPAGLLLQSAENQTLTRNLIHRCRAIEKPGKNFDGKIIGRLATDARQSINPDHYE
jgi:hypothetical protein